MSEEQDRNPGEKISGHDMDSESRPGAGKKAGRKKRGLRSKVLIAAVFLMAVIGAGFGVNWLRYYLTHASTEDARVKGDLIAISPTVQGKIRVLPIKEGERVREGQLIAQLREEDYQAKVDEAEGVVQSTEEELKEAKEDLALCRQRTEKEVNKDDAALNAARARLKEAEATLRQASLDLSRMKRLYSRESISRSELDKSKTAYDLAQARVESAKGEVKEAEARLQLAVANTSEVKLKEHRVESLKGELQEARGILALARLKLAHTTVKSPIDGIVAKKLSNIGEVIKPGQPIAIVVDLGDLWVEANLEETKVEHVRVGQSVDLDVDAYPGRRFRGVVKNIGAAAASEFALIPDNRSSGNFTKVTQRIPVKIEVKDPDRRLRPGMMVVVGIDIRDAKYGSKGKALGGVKE